jgi:hypothetical protein
LVPSLSLRQHAKKRACGVWKTLTQFFKSFYTWIKLVFGLGFQEGISEAQYFFAETIHFEHSKVLLPFIGQLEDEINNSFFQLDGVTVHTANSSTELLEEVLENA